MDISVEILKALVEMIKQGGYFAICGIVIYMGIGLMKVGLICWAVYSILAKLFQFLRDYLCLRFVSRKDQISLLTETASTELCQAVSEFQEETTKAVQDFLVEARNLLEPLKKPRKKPNVTFKEKK